MKSLWSETEAAEFSKSPVDLRAYSSRLLGREPSLVLHGGGNTSVKAPARNLFGDTEQLIYVKGTGWDLATIQAAGFSPIKLDVLQRMADLPELSDSDMVKAQRAAMTDPGAPTPSVEAILHAIIPHPYVDHTHADAVVAVSNTEEGEARIRDIYGEHVLVVPYVMPGFILARTVRQMTRDIDWQSLAGMILLNHGVFSFGSDARSSYERMIGLVTKAEDFLERRGARTSVRRAIAAIEAAIPRHTPAKPGATLPRIMVINPATGSLAATPGVDLARLRRAVSMARGGPLIARLDQSTEALAFASRADAADVATRGPLTPDHVIRTKRIPLIVDGDPDAALAAYVREYHAYFARHARPGLTSLDPAPRSIVWPSHGTVALGASVKDAQIVADITRHTIRAIEWADRLGGWHALPEKDLFEVEYWELEQAKLKAGGARPPLQGKIALVTGAASGIGRACAEALNALGAAVVGTDINQEVTEVLHKDDLVGIVSDATDRAAVRDAVETTVGRFGGLDIVVSNAGVFTPSESLADMSDAQWDRSLALNLSSHQSLLKAAIPYLRLGIDPAVVIVASKNVPAPGPGAGAYSAAKAGLTQLARVAALELAKDGIRVNVLHPHAVFDTAGWTADVLAARAKHYGMTIEEYKRNTLLGVEVTSKDVAAAVCALAGSTFAKTTGAQIPIDGGNDRVV